MQDQNWAGENLQVIRTLMERAALYRGALAPIMLWIGALGVLGGTAGIALRIQTMRTFGFYWLSVALIAVTGAFLLARRQALKNREPFWSPPTRRVAQGLLPSLVSGCCSGVTVSLCAGEEQLPLFFVLSTLFYACAVHAAGFFMPRGMKLFAWLIIGCSIVVTIVCVILNQPLSAPLWHMAMGFIFGFLHLGYGIYLYLTEKEKHVT